MDSDLYYNNTDGFVNKLPYSKFGNMSKESTFDGPSTIHEKRCVIIDSRTRNLSLYPSSTRFCVKFGASDKTTREAFVLETFRNVRSISVQDVVLPTSISDLPYIVLAIPELQDTFCGTTDITRRAFAILVPDFSTSGGSFINFRVKTHNCHCFKVFNPMISISSLTFEFYTPDGDLLSAPAEINIQPENQIAIVLQIETEIPNKPFSAMIT